MKPARPSRRVLLRRIGKARRNAENVVRRNAPPGLAENPEEGNAIDATDPGANPANGCAGALDARAELGLREPFAGEVLGQSHHANDFAQSANRNASTFCARNCYGVQMIKKPRLFIREWREYLGKPFEGVVAAAGKEQSSVYRYESGAVNPPPDALGRIADYLGVQIGDLYSLPSGYIPQKKHKITAGFGDPGTGTYQSTPPALDLPPPLPSNDEVRPAPVVLPDRQSMPRNLPVLGTAQGGTEGAFQIGGIVDYVRRPPGLERAARAYAFYVENTSMVPQHNPGELRFVHPDRKAGIGDTVVIQIKNGPEEPIQSFIKILKRRDQRLLIVEQLNPQMVLEFPIDRVVAVHKVLTLNELFEA